VKIVILHKDGKVEMATIPYTIDSAGPEFRVETSVRGGKLHVRIIGKELLRSATIVDASGKRVDLVLAADRMSLEGELDLAAGSHQLKVVVMDRARNEADKTVTVTIPASGLAKVGQ
jgi:hypothetical protein